MRRPEQIAIDGPAGSGKSTIGEQLAQRLGYLYIDTGAMYRAVAWLALHERRDINDGPVLTQLAQKAEIVISHPHIEDGRQYTDTVSGRDITWEIRNADVTAVVSIVSAHQEVREILVAQQRAMAQRGRVVMVGRDIGAVVLPNADLKIYLTASLEERARRRHTELAERRGREALPPLSEIRRDIQRRDDMDREKMQLARDAVVVETDRRSRAEVLELILRYMEDAQ